uniref:Uncharacterized protein n=1 Tax=Tanacetum cinerariifolium TaxID=118510 RepID=A0A6L2MS97_TANCI|nr:hypothetical protein [Tanacetum cinerariifolium]
MIVNSHITQPLEPGFEFDDQEWVEMGSFLFVRLEISFHREKEGDVAILKTKRWNCGACKQLVGEGDIWIGVEDEISSDEVVEKEAMKRLRFGEKMVYNSYLTSKRQHRESQMKMEIMKNFLKKWATIMSCKDI